MRIPAFVTLLLLLATGNVSVAGEYPDPVLGDFLIRNFEFRSGETLPELKIHYRTIGTIRTNAEGKVTNAVLILHGTTGNGGNFLRAEFAGVLFTSGGVLDASKYFIVLPDGIGHGASSRPSEGLRAHFPRYGYRDMVEAQYRLLNDGLGVHHLRLVMGTSMGGMHTWVWGESHPDFMDALVPLASLPAQISGRNRVWRRMIIDAIRNDSAWKEGNYETQPPGLRSALEVLYFMGSNPVRRHKESPTLAQADQALDNSVNSGMKISDANNVLYALRASEDYDPGPGLEKISAPLLAINFADDLINPPELGILEKEIKRVPHGKAILFPLSDRTNGHGTHTLAEVWQDTLRQWLDAAPLR
jgi:homoserine O-acetyltransferase